MAKRKPIRATVKSQKIVAVCDSVDIVAAQGEGDSQKPATFSVNAYNGGELAVGGYDHPIVVDLKGLKYSRNLTANYRHDDAHLVGHVTGKSTDGGKLVLSGVLSVPTEARRLVVDASRDGFAWQASIEAMPDELQEVADGEEVEANGQTFTGPLYLATKSTLLGFAFVPHGADDTTTTKIAAGAASKKEKAMKISAECREWVEAMIPSLDVESLTADEAKNLMADFEGRGGTRPKIAASRTADTLEAKKIEAKRRREVREIANEFVDAAIARGADEEEISLIQAERDEAIKNSDISVNEFRQALKIASLFDAPPQIHAKKTQGLSNDVLEAAVCMAGGLKRELLEDKLTGYSDQTLQAAHSRFKGRIGLNELIGLAASAHGHEGRISARIDLDTHNAAFNLTPGGRPPIHAAAFSTISLPTVFSNVANKFIREAFLHGDQTPFRIASTRAVNDFKEVTTASLTGDMEFKPIGPDGELEHGALGEEVYGNRVDLAGRMYAITMVHLRNDDLGALTQVPRRIGRGGILYLNKIFWTEFLNNSAFFVSDNNNVNEAIADMTIGGLAATETIFMNQTDPDGQPLGAMPAIILVPTALKAAATALMDAQSKLITGASATLSDVNVFAGRFRVESSPYMSNSTYTGFSAAAWYMLADPAVLPVIEIAGLDGNYQPIVETADAAFNTLGVQMRGWYAVGVRKQEHRAGVRADGGSS